MTYETGCDLMFLINVWVIIILEKHTNYKAECSSHIAGDTFLCMRLNLRGPTPSMMGMDDRQRTRKVIDIRLRLL